MDALCLESGSGDPPLRSGEKLAGLTALDLSLPSGGTLLPSETVSPGVCKGELVLYTDGSCHPNPGGVSGWAVVDAAGKFICSGTESPSTNQRAEVLAALGALRATETGAQVCIVTDSLYLIKCATGLWRRRKHLELWAAFDESACSRTVRFEWVRSHDEESPNDAAHYWANVARKEMSGNELDLTIEGRLFSV